MAVKKLIEVALPLDAINEASAREKSIRHGHPSTLHLWWARRPLAAARAVIWASLVDDPSSHPDKFPTEEEQTKERERLFRILEELVVWENSNNQRVLEEAKAEIEKCVGKEPLKLLDPFAGGGAIPLEAQRLGLEAYAQDLNPVAVTINKAMIEIPPKFAGTPAVNPEAQKNKGLQSWDGNAGLAADVEYYGQWMKDEAFKRIGHLYPKVKVPEEQGGGEATVIAWIWARTVKCPNPACGKQMPLLSSYALSKKKNKEAYLFPVKNDGNLRYEVKSEINADIPPKAGRGARFNCEHCGHLADGDYIKAEANDDKIGAQLVAIVAEGANGRIYLSPDKLHEEASLIEKPSNIPCEPLAYDPRNIWCPTYGLDTFDKLFTNRQLVALSTFCELIKEAQEQVRKDAAAAGVVDDDNGLADGGGGANARGEAVGVFLSFLVDKLADYHSSLVSWSSTRDGLRGTFGRQAIPMVWDFAEGNPFCSSSGSYENMLTWITKCFLSFPNVARKSFAKQWDAQSDNAMRGIVVSTDPPYYDNICYADLSDYFYVWLRKSLKSTFPKLFSTMLVPKTEELVASPYRDDRGTEGARTFFEEGMFHTFNQVYEYVTEEIPTTIYYAFKQSETETSNEVESTASTGWETMLSAIIRAGFSITGTWPMRTEMSNRNIASGTNALASSIVLVCRKRPKDAPAATRRDFIAALKKELKPALEKLQQSNIAPVDMAQSAIGPGIGVFSRYFKVLESDGTEMTVRQALQAINHELDIYFSDQDGDLDRESRFCVDLFTQNAFNDMKFGEADVLARAKNTSIEGLAEKGAVFASKGIVHLIPREDMKSTHRVGPSFTWLFTQKLTAALEEGGIEACASILKDVFDGRGDRAKALAYRLFTISEKKGWNKEALAYNSLVISWPEIQSRAAQLAQMKPVTQTLFDTEDFE